MKKFIVFLLCFVFLFGSVTAANWDNSISYSDNDLQVTFKNGFGLGSEIGTASLTSHGSVDEILKVMPGKEVLVMTYEFDFAEFYESGLGEVTFKDMRTGKNLDKEYFFATPIYSTTKINQQHTRTCDKRVENSLNGSSQLIEENCIVSSSGGKDSTYISGWKRITNNNIPQGVQTFGLITDVNKEDYIDGIWEITGKRVKRHASWTEALNVDLKSYYTFNESFEDVRAYATAGIHGNFSDSVTGINATWAGKPGDNSLFARPGFINGSLYIDSSGSPNAKINFSTYRKWGVFDDANYTVNFWVNTSGGMTSNMINLSASSSVDLKANGHIITYVVNGINPIGLALNGDQWDMVTITSNSSGIGVHRRLYLNGVLQSYAIDIARPDDVTNNGENHIGSSNSLNGWSEWGVWNRSLAPDEITTLHNNGHGITYRGHFDYSVQLIDPPNGTGFHQPPENLTCKATGQPGVENVSRLQMFKTTTAGDWAQIADSGAIDNETWTMEHEQNFRNGTHLWNCLASYWGQVGVAQNISFFINDTYLDTCEYTYNGVTFSSPNDFTCYNLAQNNITVDLVADTYNLTASFNDTVNNTANAVLNWTYMVVQHNLTYSNVTYESQYDDIRQVIRTNPTQLSSTRLWYNGTSYSTTTTDIGNGFYEITKEPFGVPIIEEIDANRTFWFDYTMANGTRFNSTTFDQETREIHFGQCNSTLTIPYFNFTFYDQGSNNIVNGTVSTASFTYWINDSAQNQTFSWSNSSLWQSHTFCAEPVDTTMSFDYSIAYSNNTAPQQIFNPGVVTANNNTNNVSLYLLGDDSGQYVTFQVINNAEQPIEGVVVTGSISIGGSPTVVYTGTTDAAGTVAFWLNPNIQHTFVFDGTSVGYNSETLVVFPTQTSYTITLGQDVSPINDFGKGINFIVAPPTSQDLFNHTNYLFEFNLTSTYWTVDEFGFELVNSTGDQLNVTRVFTNGGSSNRYLNTLNYSTIAMNAYYVIGGGNYTNMTFEWNILSSGGTGFGIKTLSDRLKTYTGTGLFGLGDFGLALLAFIFVFTFTGIISYKFGVASPTAITALMTFLVGLVDVGLGWLDALRPVAFPNVPVATILIGTLTLILMFREVYR